MEQDEFSFLIDDLTEDASLRKLQTKLNSLWDFHSTGDGDDNTTKYLNQQGDHAVKVTRLLLQEACVNDSFRVRCDADSLGKLAGNVASYIADTLTTDFHQRAPSLELAKLVPLLSKLSTQLANSGLETSICELFHGATRSFLRHVLNENFEPAPQLLNLCFTCTHVLIRTAGQVQSLSEVDQLCLQALKGGKTETTARVLTRYLPDLAAYRPAEFLAFLKSVVDILRSFFELDRNGYLEEKQSGGYSILTSIVEYLKVGVGDDGSFVRDEFFWLMIQRGLVHPDSLTRKQCMFIVRHVLDACCDLGCDVRTPAFAWDPNRKGELLETWQTLLAVLEVLEEKQAHVVRPVLSKFASFLERASGSPVVHVAWVLLPFHRMLAHESRTVVKWALAKFTASKALVEATFEGGMEKFVLGPFVEALNDSGIFARDDNDALGSLVQISKSLEQFFELCFDILSPTDRLGPFLAKLFAALSRQSWNGVSLLYLSYALLGFHKVPVVDDEMLKDVGEILTNIQRFQEPVLRASAQCYLLEVCLGLLDPKKVTFASLSRFLGLFRRDEVLARGTAHWNLTVEAIKCLLSSANGNSLLGPHNAAAFLRESVKELLKAAGPADALLPSVPRVARMAILLHDTGCLPDTVTWPALLGGCAALLGTAIFRAYLPQLRILRAAELVVALHREAESWNRGDSLQQEVLATLVPAAEEIHEYVFTQALGTIGSLDDFETSQKFYQLLDVLSTQKEYSRLLYNFVNGGIALCHEQLLPANASDDAVSIATVPRWRFLRWCLKHFPSKASVVEELLSKVIDRGGIGKPLKKPPEWIIQDRVTKSRWVALVTTVTEVIWESLTAVRLFADDRRGKLLVEAVEALETASQESCLYILRAVSHTLSLMVAVDKQLLSECLQVCWQSCKDLKKSDLFRPSVETFIALAFRSSVLLSDSRSLVGPYLEEIVDLGEVMPGVFNSLIKQLIGCWQSNRSLMIDYVDVMVKALTYGPVYRKDQRIVFDAEAFVTSRGHTLSVNQLLESEHQADVEVRARGIAFLIQLEPGSELALPMATQLSQALVRLDAEVSSARKRYFGNSTIHRVKNRIWQSQLCLLHLLDEATSCILLENVYSELVEESQQPSIRCLLEWVAVRILLGYPRLRPTLEPAMEQAGVARTGSVCSFLAVLVHLGSCLQDPDALEDHLSSYLPVILPWAMGQHFNARVYAQTALHLASQWSEQFGLGSVLEKYGPLFSCLRRGVQMGNWSRNVEKLLADFYFKDFKACSHFTLQTIFWDLPRLTGLTDRELVPVAVFDGVLSGAVGKVAVPLRNGDDSLSASRPSYWLEAGDKEAGVSVDCEDDYQRKITPWKQMLAGCDLPRDDDLGPAKKTACRDGLVVVASLIDRIPNLGGLCRTCEVFGVSEFVLNSLKHTEDRQFQGLSVSAEKWIALNEVKPHQLKEYLEEKRNAGYTLVGAEQTAGSKALHDYRFPKKTLLLLGNEKEGLPVELIQLLDVCVEIPQRGVIRSLNVHVSGAILIWEYAKQHLT
ncbi:putative methyltransferase TARBP1 [Ixodes scapularis]